MANASDLAIIARVSRDLEIYRRLFAHLDERGISDADVARATGVPATRISEGRNHAKGLGPHWARIADALSLDLNWLMLARGSPEYAQKTDKPAPIDATVVASVLSENERLMRQVGQLSDDLEAARSALSTLAQRLGTPQERPPQGDETPANGGQPPEAPSSGNPGRRTG